MEVGMRMEGGLLRLLACCKVYVSESRNGKVLEAIAAAAQRTPRAPLLNSFLDPHYNRVGYTFASSLCPLPPPSTPLPHPLCSAAFEVANTALQLVDLTSHSGSHPRLGAVDHICFHPLGAAASDADADDALNSVAALARSLAADIGSRLQVPTYLYGDAQHEGRSLVSIRRELGYFNSADSQGHWDGCKSLPRTFAPDFGPSKLTPQSGVVVVGACPWVANYNIPIQTSNLEASRQIARRVSTRGGGLPGVQAMALVHGEAIIEIACNLLNTNVSSADIVQEEVVKLAAEKQMHVLKGYFTDYSEEEITEMARLKLQEI